MTNEIKPQEDEASMAQTLRPRPRMQSLSSRPTNPIIFPKKTWFQRNLRFIIIGLVVFLFCEITFVIYKTKSKNVVKPVVIYNLPTVIIPPDIIQPIPTNSTQITTDKSISPPKIIYKPIVKSKDKDYGI
jgi:hypothetical protein